MRSSLINTINSLIGVDLDTWKPIPQVDGMSHPRWVLRTGRKTDRAQHGRRVRARSAGSASQSRALAASRLGRTP